MAAFEIAAPVPYQLQGVSGPNQFLSGIQSGMQAGATIQQLKLAQSQQQQQALLAGLQGKELELKQAELMQKQSALAAKAEEDAKAMELADRKKKASFADLLIGASDEQLPILLQGMISANPNDQVLIDAHNGLTKGQFSPEDLRSEAKAIVAGYQAIDPTFETPRMKRETELSGKVQEETRGEIRSGVAALENQAGEIKSNFSKLENLAERVRGGDRTATSQLLVALVKLGDPGSVVKESEMAAALNTPNPVAYLADKGVVDPGLMDTILATVDPLNPKTVNIDSVLATGRALVASNAPVIQEKYNRYKERGKFAGSETIFSKGRDALFSSLPSIGSKYSGAPVTPNKVEALRAQLRAKGLSDKEIDDRLKGMQ